MGVKFIDRYFVARDDRGILEGLINFGTWEEINFIRSDKGVVRGNHYHKKTIEAFFILSGRISVRVQTVRDGALQGDATEHLVEGGQVFLVEPLTFHAFTTVTDAEWINVLSQRMDPVSPDIHRL